VLKNFKGVGILGKEAKKSKDRKKSEESKRKSENRSIVTIGRQKEETEISVSNLYSEIRRLNRNLEKMETSEPLNSSSSNLFSLLGNLDLTKLIGILTVINSLMNPNQAQQTQMLPNMIQQVLPLLGTAGSDTDSKD
jgi:septal ring factor EnvC (AmiA/AmiB activator)